MNAKLSIVGTPIGNLGDLSPRALDALTQAELVVAEDTRHTRSLLKKYDLSPRCVSFHDHSTDAEVEHLLETLKQVSLSVLVSDAGMPCVSDPGQRLVDAALDADVNVDVIPGACAISAAIAWSGLRAPQFLFLGFIERRGRAREETLEQIGSAEHASVIYESPRRVRATLADLRPYLGSRRIAVMREITKRFETLERGTCDEVLQSIAPEPKGEFVMIVESQRVKETPSADWQRWADAAHAEGLSAKIVARIAKVASGANKNEVYRYMERLKVSPDAS